MKAAPSPKLVKKMQTRFDQLRSADFGIFHSSLRLFFIEFDQDETLSSISRELQGRFAAMDSRVSHYVSNNEVFKPDSQAEAAAFGERILRRIADRDEPPRPIYDAAFERGRGHVERLSPQDRNDARSLAAFKALFLEPFAHYLLEALEERDIAERNPADFDPKVGMLRNEFFDQELKQALSEAGKVSEPTSILFVDIDHFKAINTTYGQTPFGDEFLAEITDRLKAIVKNRGTWYRFGGDEFWLLLRNHNANEAALLAERIRLDIETHRFSPKSLAVTVTIGVAESPSHATTTAELKAKADEAERAAKKHGRNVVMISGEEAVQAEKPPARKIPQASGLDSEAALRIRQNYLQSGIARCPDDSALLDVQKYYIDEQVIPTLHISCPMCGLTAQIPGT